MISRRSARVGAPISADILVMRFFSAAIGGLSAEIGVSKSFRRRKT